MNVALANQPGVAVRITQRQRRRTLCTFAVACMTVTAIFWPIAQTLVNAWTHSRTYAHGALIVPAVLYMAWCERDRLLDLGPAPHSRGLFLILILACVGLLGYRTQTLVAQQVALLAMLPALVWTCFGIDILRTLRFPLGLLVFALPVGTSIEPLLQKVTTSFILAGLNLIGIPLHRDGYFITVSSGTWEVAPDCAGLRYLLPGLALGYVYTAVMHHRLTQRLTFLIMCAGALILANGIRAYSIILGDHLGIAEGTDHRVYSYAVYVVTVISLGWLGLRWGENRRGEQTPVLSAIGTSSAAELVLRPRLPR